MILIPTLTNLFTRMSVEVQKGKNSRPMPRGQREKILLNICKRLPLPNKYE